MAKSDVEKYPTILASFEQFLSAEGLTANDEDWSVLPPYEESDGNWVRPFTVKTSNGQTAGLGLSDKVPEYHN